MMRTIDGFKARRVLFFVRLALRVLGRSGQKEDFYGEEGY
jgi:hypothetical protein